MSEDIFSSSATLAPLAELGGGTAAEVAQPLAMIGSEGVATGGLDLSSMAQAMMGLNMGKSIYDWAFGSKKGGPTPVAAKMPIGGPPTSTVSAGPSVTPSPNYGSMASSLAAIQSQVSPEVVAGMNQPQLQGLVDQYQRSTGYGSMAPEPIVPPVPAAPPVPPPAGTSTQTSPGLTLGDVGAGYLKSRQVAAEEAKARAAFIPHSESPTIRPGPPVPINVGKPLAVISPLERYAMQLRRF